MAQLETALEVCGLCREHKDITQHVSVRPSNDCRWYLGRAACWHACVQR